MGRIDREKKGANRGVDKGATGAKGLGVVCTPGDIPPGVPRLFRKKRGVKPHQYWCLLFRRHFPLLFTPFLGIKVARLSTTEGDTNADSVL